LNIVWQVAFWAFPQDVYHVRAYANMADNAVSWQRAIGMLKDNKVTDMTQVGQYWSLILLLPLEIV